MPPQRVEPHRKRPAGRPRKTAGPFWRELLIALLIFAGVVGASESLTRTQSSARQGAGPTGRPPRGLSAGAASAAPPAVSEHKGSAGREQGGGGNEGGGGKEGATPELPARRRPRHPAKDRTNERPFVSHPTGRLIVAGGSDPRSGAGLLHRYIVEVEGGLGIDPEGFAKSVNEVLASQRGWGRSGAIAFKRVDGGPVSFRVSLASPGTTDRLCAPLVTGGIYSCHQGGLVALNSWRWTEGADSFGEDLAGYRRYMINHEVGHALGRGHAYCSSPGSPAPIMMQQTKGVDGCTPNPWPLDSEL